MGLRSAAARATPLEISPERLLASVRRLAPAGCCVAGGWVEAARNAVLFESEAALAQRCVPARRLQFQAGRHYARAALQALGCAPTPLLRAHGAGRPIWPTGYCGSIAHSGPLCLVAAAQHACMRALGVDIEQDEPLAEEAMPLICAHEELAQAGVGAPRRAFAKLLFVAKEASFKLICGLGRDPVELRAMHARPIAPELIEVRFASKKNQHNNDAFAAHVRHGADQGYIFAVATPAKNTFAQTALDRHGRTRHG